jgi:hypothetical protein
MPLWKFSSITKDWSHCPLWTYCVTRCTGYLTEADSNRKLFTWGLFFHFKIFSPKKIVKQFLGFSLKMLLLWQKVFVTLVFTKNAIFCTENGWNWPKIVILTLSPGPRHGFSTVPHQTRVNFMAPCPFVKRLFVKRRFVKQRFIKRHFVKW